MCSGRRPCLSFPPLHPDRHGGLPLRALMTCAAFLLSVDAYVSVYSDAVRTRLGRHVQLGPIVTPPQDWRQHRDALAPVEIIFSGWGAPVMDEALLRAMP